MKKLFIGLFLVIGCLTLIGCDKKEKEVAPINNSNNSSSNNVEENNSNPIVGTWEYKDSQSRLVYVFRQNNTGSTTTYMGNSILENDEFTYSINGNKITFLFSATKEEMKDEFKINGNTLVINGLGNDMKFIKK